jgi:hypothetical protein
MRNKHLRNAVVSSSVLNSLSPVDREPSMPETLGRGVYCEPCPDRPGYVHLTVIDSCDRVLCDCTMLAEWIDETGLERAHAKLDQSDPEYARTFMTHSIRLKLMPASSEGAASPEISGDQAPVRRWVRGRAGAA